MPVPLQRFSDLERIMLTKTAYIETRSDSLRALETEIDRLTDYANEATVDVAAVFYEAIAQLGNRSRTSDCQAERTANGQWRHVEAGRCDGRCRSGLE